MKYKQLHVNPEHYYSVGVDEETGEYLIEVIITWVAWYSIYFRLTPEEVSAFKDDPESLTPLANELAADRGNDKFCDRLVYNQGPKR